MSNVNLFNLYPTKLAHHSPTFSWKCNTYITYILKLYLFVKY